MHYTREQRIEIIEEALSLLGGGERWVKGAYKKRRGGEVCFCVGGAVEQACVNLGYRKEFFTRNAERDAESVLGNPPWETPLWSLYNDSPSVSWHDLNRKLRERLRNLRRKPR